MVSRLFHWCFTLVNSIYTLARMEYHIRNNSPGLDHFYVFFMFRVREEGTSRTGCQYEEQKAAKTPTFLTLWAVRMMCDLHPYDFVVLSNSETAPKDSCWLCSSRRSPWKQMIIGTLVSAVKRSHLCSLSVEAEWAPHGSNEGND